MPEVAAWQNRALEAMYPFVFLDAIHYKVKENRQYVTKAAYEVLGITRDGRKEILGVWIGEHESAKFWASVLNDLKTRGVQGVYLFCVDGLSGFREGLNRQFRKVTKNKPSFSNDDSLRKMLYLAAQNITRHWNGTCRNWDMVSNYLRILFEENTACEEFLQLSEVRAHPSASF